MPDPETPPVDLGQEPVSPAEPPGIPSEPPVLPEEPPEPPSEPSPEDQLLHKLQSWVGRRDVELREEMDKREQRLLEQLQQRAVSPASPPETPDPSVDANAWFDHKIQETARAAEQYNTTLVSTGNALIDQDELVKTDPKLKDEIIQEVQSGRVQINRALDAQTAASVAVAQAKANVLSRRVLQKPNPLENNTPSNTPKGGITPPAAPSAPPVKLPKMTDLASQKAKEWGYTDEDLAKILNE